MLQSGKSVVDSDLRFHLLVKLAYYYLRDGKQKESIETLRTALSIKPTNLIANCRIAMLLESIGNGNEAITHYDLAQKDKVVSPSLYKYLAAQVQRVKIHGPREKGPWEDSGLQWLPG
jgi:tetratricopeptide (TPR) repeat protein